MNWAGRIAPSDERIVPNKEIGWRKLQRHISRYLFASEFVQHRVVLDVACGSGYGSAYLTSKGAKIVIGGDISRDALWYGATHYQHLGDRLRFICLDARQLPFHDNCFDTIVSFETIEHLDHHLRFLNECRRVLKDDGTLICSTPNREVTSLGLEKPLTPYHVKEFFVNEFRHVLSHYFQEIAMYGMETVTPRGRIINSAFKFIVQSVPRGTKVLNLLSTFFAASDRHVKMEEMEEMKEMDFSQFVCRQFYPVPLQDDALTPRTIVAVAR